MPPLRGAPRTTLGPVPIAKISRPTQRPRSSAAGTGQCQCRRGARVLHRRVRLERGPQGPRHGTRAGSNTSAISARRKGPSGSLYAKLRRTCSNTQRDERLLVHRHAASREAPTRMLPPARTGCSPRGTRCCELPSGRLHTRCPLSLSTYDGRSVTNDDGRIPHNAASQHVSYHKGILHQNFQRCLVLTERAHQLNQKTSQAESVSPRGPIISWKFCTPLERQQHNDNQLYKSCTPNRIKRHFIASTIRHRKGVIHNSINPTQAQYATTSKARKDRRQDKQRNRRHRVQRVPQCVPFTALGSERC